MILFSRILSMLSILGLSGTPQLPHLHLAHGYLQGADEPWTPAGPAMDTLFETSFTDVSSEFEEMQISHPSVDFADGYLSPTLVDPFVQSSNLVATQPQYIGVNELEFNLANNFWGCDFHFGQYTCGTYIRQGIAHLIDKTIFVDNEGDVKGSAAAIDNPLSPGAAISTPTPCNWDSNFPETGSKCIVGGTQPGQASYTGGIAYHLASASGVCVPSTLGGCNTFAWMQNNPSPDFCAAAYDIKTGVNMNIPPEAQHPGTGFYLASPPGGTFPKGDTSSWTFNAQTDWRLVAAGDISTDTSTVGAPAGTCNINSRVVSGRSAIQQANVGSCSNSSVPPQAAADYMYLCDQNYDRVSNQMEFANCLTAEVGADPRAGQTTPTFGNCTSGNGGGSSAVSAAYKAEDTLGTNAYTIPLYTKSVQYGFLNNGWTHVINAGGTNNYFSLLNAWNPHPAQPGSLSLGISTPVHSLNPYIASNPLDVSMLSGIYDSLNGADPYDEGALINWMVISALPQTSLPYTPPQGTVLSYRFTLRPNLNFQEGKMVTAFDVAFSYLSLLGTGSILGDTLSSVSGITVLSMNQFDLNLNVRGPFILSSVTAAPILPGRWWTSPTPGQSNGDWDNGVANCSSNCFPSQYTLSSSMMILNSMIPAPACALNCDGFPPRLLAVNPAMAGNVAFDPVAKNVLIC